MGAPEVSPEGRGSPDVEQGLRLKLIEFGRDKRSAVEDTLLAILIRVPAYRPPTGADAGGVPAHDELWPARGPKGPLDLLADDLAARACRSLSTGEERRAA